MTEDKLCADYENYNFEIERVTKQEIMKVREEIDALKAKAAKVREVL